MPILDPINTDQTQGNAAMTAVGEQQRTILATKNDYTEDNQYSATHPDAMADGDEKGRGTGSFMDVDNPNAGTSVDIAQRNTQMAVNAFGPNNTYPNF